MAKVEKTCGHCGRSFSVIPARKAARFCSNSCRGFGVAAALQRKASIIQKVCEICGEVFGVKPYRKDTARFCSRNCRAKWVSSLPHACGRGKERPYMRGNQFRKGLRPAHTFPLGHEPWNKNLKGIHLSPASEFKAGPRPEARAEIGTVSIRKTHDGNLRAYIKVAHPNKWSLRATKVWEDVNGPVPRGYIIHHEDRNPLNDVISNLQCMTKSDHAFEHRLEISAARWPKDVSL
jgi:hypothetical protein